jgi:TetR/AcrR family transcriptional regulator, transcriptional repressor of bet genes
VTEAPQRLLDALVAVLVEEGFEGVSVRKVAARAGVSIGAVQHHFPTKDVMLAAAMDRASAEFEQRLTARVPADATAEQALRAVVDELLGLGPERRTASVVWLARLARASVDEATRRTHARDWQQVEDLLSGLLQATRPDLGPDRSREDAGLLLALLDGLAMAALTEPDRMPPERAERLVAGFLDDIVATAS